MIAPINTGGPQGDGLGNTGIIPARYDIPANLLNPHGAHGQDSVLPGWEGVPFRGATPDLKETDAEQKQPVTGFEVHVEILDFSKPEDLQRYENIWQLCANQFAVLSSEHTVYDKASKTWRVLIRWALKYAANPASN